MAIDKTIKLRVKILTDQIEVLDSKRTPLVT